MIRKACIALFPCLILAAATDLLAQAGWTSAMPMPTARSGMCSVVLNGKIYVIGGRDGAGQILRSVEVYDPVNNSWENASQLEKAREDAAAVVFKGTPYVIGGRDTNGQPLGNVEFYDKKDEWEEFKELRTRRAGLAAVVLGNKLYAIGGLTVSNEVEQFLDSVELYDSGNDEWVIVDDWQLDFAKASFSTTVFNDSAFSIGGFSTLGPLGFVQRYHPDVGMASRPNLLNARGGLAVATAANKIFAMGGFGESNQVLASVEYFQSASGNWKMGASLMTAREAFVSATANGSIYVIGGRGLNGQALASVEVAAPNDIVTSVESSNLVMPLDFMLEQNYPNPFNPATKVAYHISTGSTNAKVQLNVYNLRGELVKTLVEGELSAGGYQVIWDSTDNNGAAVASGIYLYTLSQGALSISKKMLLIR